MRDWLAICPTLRGDSTQNLRESSAISISFAVRHGTSDTRNVRSISPTSSGLFRSARRRMAPRTPISSCNSIRSESLRAATSPVLRAVTEDDDRRVDVLESVCRRAFVRVVLLPRRLAAHVADVVREAEVGATGRVVDVESLWHSACAPRRCTGRAPSAARNDRDGRRRRTRAACRRCREVLPALLSGPFRERSAACSSVSARASSDCRSRRCRSRPGVCRGQLLRLTRSPNRPCPAGGPTRVGGKDSRRLEAMMRRRDTDES